LGGYRAESTTRVIAATKCNGHTAFWGTSPWCDGVAKPGASRWRFSPHRCTPDTCAQWTF